MNFQTLKANCPDWETYINHTFVQQLTAGTLPIEAFRYYLEQDYLFLLHFTRAWALALYKSDNLADMRAAQQGINAMLDEEIGLHIKYCAGFGVSQQQLENLPEHSATVAYTRYVLDCGVMGTLTELHTAIAPCLLGYAEIGQRAKASSAPNNPYQSWIDMYASEAYQQAAEQGRINLDRLLTKADKQKVQTIFNTAVRMEIAFWQMGLSAVIK